jgi:hypothetical protein
MLNAEQKQTSLAILSILVLIAVAWTAAFYGSYEGPNIIQSIQPPRDHQSYETKGNQYNSNKLSKLSAEHSLSIEIKCDPNCVANNPNQEIGQEQFSAMLAKFREDPIELITAIIAIANIVLSILIFVEIGDGRRSSERQLRAYVGVEVSRKDTPIFDPNKNITVILKITNRGSTPAYKLKIASFIQIHKVPLTETLRGVPDTAHSITLGPSASTKTMAVFMRPLTEGEKTAILDENSSIYIWGKITYTDAFGSDRFTGWKMEWAFRSDGTHAIVSCADGNEAD